MRKRNFLVTTSLLLVIILSVTACTSLDVVGRTSITAFDEVLKRIPDEVKTNELNAGWEINAPDGSARFIWSADYSKAGKHDAMLEFDQEPFVKAGLDISKLSDKYTAYDNMLMVGKKFGGKEKTRGDASAIAAYKLIVNNYRDSINYHTTLDHYGIKLGDGNMFEWAKDLKINGYDKTNQDKDIVFVLNPEPLIAAGVAPEKVNGWVYAQVPIVEDGKTVKVWKFLKPFNIQ